MTNDIQRLIDRYHIKYSDTVFGSHGGVVDANKEMKELIAKYRNAIVSSISRHLESHFTGLFSDDDLDEKYPINFKNGEQKIEVELNNRDDNYIEGNKLFFSISKREMEIVLKREDPKKALSDKVNSILDIILN